MPTTSAQMSLTIPTLNGDPGVWDTYLSASLETIDLHDHTTGKGVKVPSAGLNINADLTFAGYAATNLKAAAFTTQASYSTNSSLWVKTSDGELYWRNATGTDVKVTSGASLNLSLVGGIAGDYAAASASLYYDDAAEAYRFLEAAPAPNDWSYVKAGGVDVYEHASGIANYVALRSPAALAATYTVTFPAAVPGSTQLVQVSSAGAMTFSNTVVNSLTMTANAHITVSGTGQFKHGDRVRALSPYNFVGDGNWSVTGSVTFADVGYISATAAGRCAIPINLDEGERIKSVVFARYGDGVADFSAIEVFKLASNGTVTDITAAPTSENNPPASWADTTVDVTDTTLAAGETLYIRFAANAANLRIGSVRVTYDRP